MVKVIAVDFDGCICTNEYPDIGEPNWAVIYSLKKEIASGSKLILWTCREGDSLEKAIKACKRWGIKFDAVNDNLSEVVDLYGLNSRKVSATEYWDGRAVKV